jgi:hypothetical protein
MSFHLSESEILAFVLLLGVLCLVFYAVKHNNGVRAMFDCKLFSFSLETEKAPPKNPKA